MNRVINPLIQMGAEISSQQGGTAPLNITGGRSLKGISYEMPVASAQVKSCILLAGIYAEGMTEIDRWLFVNTGPKVPPAPPYEEPGQDPTPDTLTCEG